MNEQTRSRDGVSAMLVGDHSSGKSMRALAAAAGAVFRKAASSRSVASLRRRAAAARQNADDPKRDSEAWRRSDVAAAGGASSSGGSARAPRVDELKLNAHRTAAAETEVGNRGGAGISTAASARNLGEQLHDSASTSSSSSSSSSSSRSSSSSSSDSSSAASDASPSTSSPAGHRSLRESSTADTRDRKTVRGVSGSAQMSVLTSGLHDTPGTSISRSNSSQYELEWLPVSKNSVDIIVVPFPEPGTAEECLCVAPVSMSGHHWKLTVDPFSVGGADDSRKDFRLCLAPVISPHGLCEPGHTSLECRVEAVIGVLRTAPAAGLHASAWRETRVTHTFTPSAASVWSKGLLTEAELSSFIGTHRNVTIRVSFRTSVTVMKFHAQRFFELHRRVESPKFVVGGCEWAIRLHPTVVAHRDLGHSSDDLKHFPAVRRQDGTRVGAYVLLKRIRDRSENAAAARPHGCAIIGGQSLDGDQVGTRYSAAERPCRVGSGWGVSWFVPLHRLRKQDGSTTVSCEMLDASTVFEWQLSSMFRVKHRIRLDDVDWDVWVDEDGLYWKCSSSRDNVAVRVCAHVELVRGITDSDARQLERIEHTGTLGAKSEPGIVTGGAGGARHHRHEAAAAAGVVGTRAKIASSDIVVKDFGEMTADLQTCSPPFVHECDVKSFMNGEHRGSFLRIDVSHVHAWKDRPARDAGVLRGVSGTSSERDAALSRLTNRARRAMILHRELCEARMAVETLAADAAVSVAERRQLATDNATLQSQVEELSRQLAGLRKRTLDASHVESEKDFAVLSQARPPPWRAVDVWIEARVPSKREVRDAQLCSRAVCAWLSSSEGMPVVDVLATGALFRGTALRGELAVDLFAIVPGRVTVSKLSELKSVAAAVIDRESGRRVMWRTSRDFVWLEFLACDVSARLTFVGQGDSRQRHRSLSAARESARKRSSRRQIDNVQQFDISEVRAVHTRATHVFHHVTEVDSSGALRRAMIGMHRWASEQPWGSRDGRDRRPDDLVLELICVDTYVRYSGRPTTLQRHVKDLLRATLERLAAWSSLQVTWTGTGNPRPPYIADPADHSQNLAHLIGRRTAHCLREFALAAIMTFDEQPKSS